MSDETKKFNRQDMIMALTLTAGMVESAQTSARWCDVLAELQRCQAFARKAKATCARAESL